MTRMGAKRVKRSYSGFRGCAALVLAPVAAKIMAPILKANAAGIISSAPTERAKLPENAILPMTASGSTFHMMRCRQLDATKRTKAARVHFGRTRIHVINAAIRQASGEANISAANRKPKAPAPAPPICLSSSLWRPLGTIAHTGAKSSFDPCLLWSVASPCPIRQIPCHGQVRPPARDQGTREKPHNHA